MLELLPLETFESQFQNFGKVSRICQSCVTASFWVFRDFALVVAVQFGAIVAVGGNNKERSQIDTVIAFKSVGGGIKNDLKVFFYLYLYNSKPWFLSLITLPSSEQWTLL